MDLTISKLLPFAEAVSMTWEGRNQIAMGWNVNGAQGMRERTKWYHFKTRPRGRKRVVTSGVKRLNQSGDVIQNQEDPG